MSSGPASPRLPSRAAGGLPAPWERLPGAELVHKGLRDLALGEETVESLLVSIGAPRLRRLGLPVPEKTFPSPEHRLYELLFRSGPDSAHGRYNALVRRLVSFERTAGCGG